MSYRELRNFKEIMCTLGYPRLISIENFKVPHFELVADILQWLCHRYDPNMEYLKEIRTEHDRVAMLKSVAEQLLVKVGFCASLLDAKLTSACSPRFLTATPRARAHAPS